jgi:hypothetical protein
MNEPWLVEAPGVSSFRCDGFGGRFFSANESARTLHGQLEHPFKADLFSLGSLDFEEENGRQGSINPLCKASYIQNPYLIAPQFVEGEPGLHVTAFIRASSDGLDADFRLTTISNLKRAALECDCNWASGLFEPRLDILADLDHPKASPGVVVARLNIPAADPVWMYLDVGEHGGWKVHEEDIGTEFLQCDLFKQPLEKGVILVGRFALRRLANEAAVRENLLQWLDKPTASL